MALVRILIDGYSLLHQWHELAPGKPRHSAAARDDLIHRMTLYQDAVKTPITLVFDGGGAPAGTPKPISKPELELLYSRSGQTADDLIERAALRFVSYGEVLVVTDDNAERDTVAAGGATVSSCLNFIREVESALEEQQRDIKKLNQRERKLFKNGRK